MKKVDFSVAILPPVTKILRKYKLSSSPHKGRFVLIYVKLIPRALTNGEGFSPKRVLRTAQHH